VALAGCDVFTVHARNAWLKGLSPKENREVPPLRYELAYRLKTDFPALTIVVNGGIVGTELMHAHLQHVDGVMIGREAYHNPWTMVDWDAQFWPEPDVASPAQPPAVPTPSHSLTRESVEEAMVAYMAEQASEHGTPWSHIARHMLGLRNGTPGARKWRQVWSDHRLKHLPAADVMAQARAVLA
jgi:tRNA-dihydrouridine synthase A